MTNLADALIDVSALASFDGMPVVRTTVAVTNAGDGLSQSMRIDPRELHQGETHYVVLECVVQEVLHKPLAKDEPSGPQVRVHKLKAGVATLVDAALVRQHLDDQREKNRKAAEAAKGIERLPFNDDEADYEPDDEVTVDEVPPPFSTPAADDFPRDADGFADPALDEGPHGSPADGSLSEPPADGIDVPPDGSLSVPLEGDGTGTALPDNVADIGRKRPPRSKRAKAAEAT